MPLDTLLEDCRSRGIKITPQRVALFEALLRREGHLSAEELFQDVRQRYPTLSFATVYNTLQLLVRMGRVREVIVDELRRRYDINTDPHHHAICRQCHRITDIRPQDVGMTPGPPATDLTRYGFQVESVAIEFSGLCAECAAAS
jgi:Fur family peroxide stress response transcriptional regulator